ncbi:hypothetical protein ACIGXM_14660 [Kitasatospora sp. NPDC052896]|uniref:hypothetical protein n=1 Tax=Kitasatospora sp. NPDC052896 TaxID=3364061 RepID=UPI0037C97CFF
MELALVFQYPDLLARGDDTLVMVVADGETEQEVYARAWTAAWAQMARAPQPLPVQPRGVPAANFDRPYVDIRGKDWYQDGRVHWGVLLPSYYRLLERVNFHPGRRLAYTPVGIGQEKSLWLVDRLGGRWPEYLIFPADSRSFSREEAIENVKGPADRLRARLLEMGCVLSPHEKQQLHEIRDQLRK